MEMCKIMIVLKRGFIYERNLLDAFKFLLNKG